MRYKTRLKPEFSLIDLTPLVDVIFLLIIFFVITSEILPLKSLPIHHPKLPIESTPLTSQIVIVVDRYQVIYVGSKKMIVDIETLKTKIQEEAPQNSNALTLVLSMDESVPYSTFIDVFQILQQFNCPIRLVYEQI